ncbi:MAG TPA: hypothetical protein ENN77_01135 [Candidatus Wirthbacteria bacterium]|nr:hypothetical protein [Candidatus Wirthbacteria bacterium]
MNPRADMPPKQPKASTQSHLDIEVIRDGIVRLKTGGYRAVLRTTNVNFSLKSEMEQNAMIFAYRNFLNALAYPVQILIRSRALNIDNYLDGLKKYEEAQENELLKLQTSEYIDYIRRLIEVANILDRQFYVCVPYSSGGDEQVKMLTGLFGSKKKYEDTYFDSAKKQLQQRCEALSSHLSGVGVKSKQLTTKEIIQLFYDIYNPGTAQLEKLEINPEELTTPVTTFKSKQEMEEIEHHRQASQTVGT